MGKAKRSKRNKALKWNEWCDTRRGIACYYSPFKEIVFSICRHPSPLPVVGYVCRFDFGVVWISDIEQTRQIIMLAKSHRVIYSSWYFFRYLIHTICMYIFRVLYGPLSTLRGKQIMKLVLFWRFVLLCKQVINKCLEKHVYRGEVI